LFIDYHFSIHEVDEPLAVEFRSHSRYLFRVLKFDVYF